MEKGIKMYYKESERNCLLDYANDSHPLGYYCPCLPTGLSKSHAVYMYSTNVNKVCF